MKTNLKKMFIFLTLIGLMMPLSNAQTRDDGGEDWSWTDFDVFKPGGGTGSDSHESFNGDNDMGGTTKKGMTTFSLKCNTTTCKTYFEGCRYTGGIKNCNKEKIPNCTDCK